MSAVDIVFLGCGAAYYPALGNTGAYFKLGSHLYVLDCGATVFQELIRHNILDGVISVTAFISHLHADHAGSLGLLLCYCHDVLNIRPLVLHPLSDIVNFLDMCGVEREAYEWKGRDFGELPRKVRYRFFSLAHVPEIPSFGYVIGADGERIYFSGDSSTVPQEVLDLLFDGKIDFLFQDTSLFPSSHHCYYEHLAQLIPPSLRSRVLCMHIDGMDTSPLKDAGFSIARSDYRL